ncbi:tetratricopeptide repeat protein (plasmid) [Burkholderia sp. JSH-S8]|uniref:tetratricopeptide repeat protein n=1 Tax=Burkholderia stagnalis TaxID=1503054 RepID=UPI0013E0D695|nr:tetratricopeptide repeat protein [Burkholderia stagnalis]WGS47636.1 tetratricopeptide repeat protein [Burkholderia sp. JSH-S8]
MSSIPDQGPSGLSRVLSMLEVLARLPRDLWPYVLTWAIVILAIPFCELVVSGAVTQHLQVPPVDTPKSLVERGYTPEFLTQRIMAEMSSISSDSVWVPHDPPLSYNAPDFKLPGQEMSYSSLVGLLKTIAFPDKQDVVVHIGITRLSDREDSYQAHVRIENGPFNALEDDVPFTGNDFNRSVHDIAVKVMRLADPNTLASHLVKVKNEINKCSLEKCDYHEAEEIYDRLLERPSSPQRQWALAGKGWLLLRQNRFKEAELQTRDALLRYPHSAILRANLGLALEQEKQFDDALRELRAGAREESSTADNQRLLGDVLLHAERYDEALKAFRRANEMRPKDAQILHDWGEALVKNGQYEEAIATLSVAVDLRPDLAPSYAEWGRALEGQGDFPHAAQKYAEAEKRDPEALTPHETQLALLDMKYRASDLYASQHVAGREIVRRFGFADLMPDLRQETAL